VLVAEVQPAQGGTMIAVHHVCGSAGRGPPLRQHEHFTRNYIDMSYLSMLVEPEAQATSSPTKTSSQLRRAGSDVNHVTCVYPLVAALLSSEPRPEPRVNDMSHTQNRRSTRASFRWT
jgi:hypothetical protein